MAAPSERTGLNVLATWAGSASTVTFWASAVAANRYEAHHNS